MPVLMSRVHCTMVSGSIEKGGVCGLLGEGRGAQQASDRKQGSEVAHDARRRPRLSAALAG